MLVQTNFVTEANNYEGVARDNCVQDERSQLFDCAGRLYTKINNLFLAKFWAILLMRRRIDENI